MVESPAQFKKKTVICNLRANQNKGKKFILFMDFRVKESNFQKTALVADFTNTSNSSNMISKGKKEFTSHVT